MIDTDYIIVLSICFLVEDWHMLQDEYDAVKNELTDLKNKRQKFEDKLKQSYSEEDIIECKYQIKKIDKEMPVLRRKCRILRGKLRQQKENDFLYKKLYVELDDYLISEINQIFNINPISDECTLRYLVENYYEYQIYTVVNLLKALSPSERGNFIKTMDAQNISGDFSEKSLYDLIELLRILSLSEQVNFIKTINAQNISIDVLVNSYCDSITEEMLNPRIKNLFEDAESSCIKFKKYENGELNVIYDLSQKFELESYLLKEFDYYLKDIITKSYYNETGSDVDWEDIPEYDKLRFMPKDVSQIIDDSFYDTIYDMSIGEFDFYLEIKYPEHTTPIIEQTSEYKQRKLYKRNVDNYNRLIEKKRQEKQSIRYENICNKKLTKESPIEDIADCFCKIEGFNAWEYDKKDSKKIVFKVLHADGKNYSRMKKVEVKKLKKWADKYFNLTN